MPAYKLTYFNGKGRAEPVRLLFAHAGIEYTDNRVEGPNWPALKPTTPWGNMPILEEGDFKLSQSVAVLQYVGNKHGYAGENDMETAKCNEYIGAVTDFYQVFMQASGEQDAGKKKEKLTKFLEETTPFYLKKFEAIVGQNGKFLVGSKVTYADFYFAHIIQSHLGGYPDALEDYPALQKHQETIFELPGVKEWVAKRPVTAF